MIQHVTYLYQFNLGFAQTLVKDLSPEQMVQQPSGVINHPAWSLGHLAGSADSLAQLLGLTSQAPDGWDKIFATGGTPSGDLSLYPSKDEILDALKNQHARNTEAVQQADPEMFARPHPNEGARKYFPTVGDMCCLSDDVTRDGPPWAGGRVASRDGTRVSDRCLAAAGLSARSWPMCLGD